MQKIAVSGELPAAVRVRRVGNGRGRLPALQRKKPTTGLCAGRSSPLRNDRYLVDPASSHMLVSKIKPCMSKYILLHGETANGSLDQLWFLRSYNPTWITVVILELIHESALRLSGKSVFITTKPIGAALGRPSPW